MQNIFQQLICLNNCKMQCSVGAWAHVAWLKIKLCIPCCLKIMLLWKVQLYLSRSAFNANADQRTSNVNSTLQEVEGGNKLKLGISSHRTFFFLRFETPRSHSCFKKIINNKKRSQWKFKAPRMGYNQYTGLKIKVEEGFCGGLKKNDKWWRKVAWWSKKKKWLDALARLAQRPHWTAMSTHRIKSISYQY